MAKITYIDFSGAERTIEVANGLSVMEGAIKLRVPLVVDVKAGPNWQDMEKIK